MIVVMDISKMNIGTLSPQHESAQDISLLPKDSSKVKESDELQPNSDNDEISMIETKDLVDGLNSFLEPYDTSIRYEFHEKLDRYYVTIVDSQTDEVVKEIPPKKIIGCVRLNGGINGIYR